ncbi:MAG TPA: DUF983 domain-containing protein [Bacteroidia bacterium]|nr:DUF983 domain-containing protein [Bacteroidia bacterium]
MKIACPVCGQKYVPETGFYYGAMYISYALSVVLIFIPASIMYFKFEVEFRNVLFTVLGIYLLGFPYIFRLSRNIWLNIFVRFDPELHNRLMRRPDK